MLLLYLGNVVQFEYFEGRFEFQFSSFLAFSLERTAIIVFVQHFLLIQAIGPEIFLILALHLLGSNSVGTFFIALNLMAPLFPGDVLDLRLHDAWFLYLKQFCLILKEEFIRMWGSKWSLADLKLDLLWKLRASWISSESALEAMILALVVRAIVI